MIVSFTVNLFAYSCVYVVAVDPVVQGKTRAEQFLKDDKEGK